MKKVWCLALLVVLILALPATSALADIGNPNGTRTTLTATGETAEAPAYIADAKAALGDDYLNVYGFKFNLTNNAAMFFSVSVVTEEDLFPARYFGGFTNSAFVVQTFESMGLFADYWDIVEVPAGGTGTFTLTSDAPIFTSANSGRLLFTEDAAFASGGGTVDLSSFVWLDQSGAAIVSSAAAGGAGTGSPRTADDMNVILWSLLGAAGLCGCVVILVSFRKKGENA